MGGDHHANRIEEGSREHFDLYGHRSKEQPPTSPAEIRADQYFWELDGRQWIDTGIGFVEVTSHDRRSLRTEIDDEQIGLHTRGEIENAIQQAHRYTGLPQTHFQYLDDVELIYDLADIEIMKQWKQYNLTLRRLWLLRSFTLMLGGISLILVPGQWILYLWAAFVIYALFTVFIWFYIPKQPQKRGPIRRW